MQASVPLPDGLLESLLQGPAAPEQIARVGLLDEPVREQLVDALKAELDRLQRRSPALALPLADTLVALAHLVPGRAALCHRGRAVALHANGHSAAALPEYRHALALYEAQGQHLEATRVRRSLVDVLQMSGQAREALEVGHLARASLAGQDQPQLLAQLESNLGNVFFRLERYAEAEVAYRRASEAFEGLGDSTGRAFALYNLANVETNAHRFAAAEQHFNTALELFQRAGLSVLEADCRYGLAYLDFRRGRYAEAQAGLERSREEYRQLNKPGGTGLCTLDLAELFLKLEAYRDAAEAAESAAREFRKLGLTAEQARAEYFGALAHLRLEQPQLAAAGLELAAGLWRNLGNRTSAALIELDWAACDDRLTGPERLLRLNDAAKELEASGDRFLAGLGQLALARAELAQEALPQAQARLEALLASSSGDQPLAELSALDAWTLLGELKQRQGDLNGAATAWQQALALSEATYGRLARGDARLAFFRERHPTYARLAVLRLLQRRQPLEAIELLETGRHRSLLERPDQPLSGALAEARARLDREMSAALDRRLATGEAGELRRLAAAEESQWLHQAQDEVLRLARAQQTPAPALAVEVAFDPRLEVLLGHAALAYFLADGEQLWLVYGQARSLRSTCLKLTAKRLQELAGALRFQLSKVRLGADYMARHRAALLGSTERLLAELGAGLFAELVDSLPAGTPLLLVPYGPLHDLPLQATLCHGLPLIERHPLVIARSLRQLAERRARPAPGAPIWLCGAPEAGLPAIATELEALRSIYGGRAEVLTPAELFQRLAQPGELPVAALHLAAHGSFQPEHPLFSGLRLGERFLTAFDLSRLRLAGTLVSLSGCETGRARRSRSDELYGPEQALLRAGAGAVVSSLWPVEDQASASAMLALHRGLAAGLGLRQAMREAQLLERRRDPHPFGWAAFLATGAPDWRLA